MVVGFLKGIWGKPATQATGLTGMWGTIKSVPSKVIGTISSPFKAIPIIIGGIITVIVLKKVIK